jgi:acetylornithine deacetylase/succinyl-diaminopimelate desuccinylase-like protein
VLQGALSYAQAQRGETLAKLQAFMRIPSISTLSEHAPDMLRAADWLAADLAAIGMQNIRLLPTPSHPVVYADWLHAGPAAPTLLIYGHYDVQPVDPLDEWLSPPFSPTVRGDDLFGRGATDDKGQLYTHLAACAAYLKTAGRLPLNVKLMLEGDEETGSPGLDDFMREHRDLLQADAAVISDLPIVDPDTPALVTSVRGLVYLEITMRGPRQDLHSGLYGGAVENPLNAMARLLAALQDERGLITIPGFYDAVRELTPAERAELSSGPPSEAEWLALTGAPTLWGEAGYSVTERVGARPTLDVHGIAGGFTGQGQKTVIPATASAKVSMRLVPDQQAQTIAQLVAEHIRRLSPPTMSVTVEILSADDPAGVDLSTPAVAAAAQAYERGFGRRPIYQRDGASLPIVALFHQLFSIPVVLMGFGLPDDNLHAPNEKIHLPNFYRGIETVIHYYDLLAGQGTGGF